jgi:predicted MFS family arabinose efflux permease
LEPDEKIRFKKLMKETDAARSGGQVQPANRPPRLVWQLATATLCRIVLNTARRFVYPFAPALSRELQVPLTAITSLIAVNQASSLAGLFIGPLADRWGYRSMMRSGLLLLATGMLICWIAPVYGLVFIGLMLAGAGKTAYDPALQAFIGQRIPFSKRGTAIGAVETAWAGSALIGIPVIAVIIDGFGVRWTFFAMAVMGAMGWLMLGRAIRANDTAAPGHGRSLGMGSALLQLIRFRPAAGMLGFGFLIAMANDNLFVVYGAWLEKEFGMGIVALGLSSSVIGAAELTGESLTALLGDRIGIKRFMILSSCMTAIGYLMLPIIGTTLPLGLFGLFLIFLFFEAAMVSSFSLGTEVLPSARGTMMAGYFAAAGLGRMAGAFTGGALWLKGGLTVVMMASAAITVVALICLRWGLAGWRAEDHLS